MALTQIKASNITDGTVVAAEIGDNVINSEHYAAASIDNEHLADDAVGIAELSATGTASNSTFLRGDNAWATASTVSLTADQAWTGSQRATMVTDNDGSFYMNAGQNFNCTPSGNFTLTFTNIANGQSGFIILINSGGHTVSKASTTKSGGDFATTVSAAGTYILSYISNGTNVYVTNSAAMG